MQEIGRRIKSARLEKRMVQSDIASKIGVAVSTVQRYEAGTIDRPKRPVLQAIAEALDVDPAWLIGKTAEKGTYAQVYPSPPAASAQTYEGNLVHLARQLNADGQEKLIDYAADLVCTGRYKKTPEPSVGANSA